MKCPKCGKTNAANATHCRYCSTRFIRKSDKMARKMALSGRFAMVCGGFMAFMGIMMMIYARGPAAYILLGLGVALTIIGLKTR